jgi:hypothetical protein
MTLCGSPTIRRPQTSHRNVGTPELLFILVMFIVVEIQHMLDGAFRFERGFK